jgi:metal-responsive CopG/Arc/MetJ family transcriptional regulator
MKTISLRIEESILTETDKMINTIKKTRNKYIVDALDYYNKIQKRKLLENQYKIESSMVADSSMEVLKEFEKLNDDLD